jgi:hypothetical protein
LIRYNAFGDRLSGWRKIAYKVARHRVPRTAAEPTLLETLRPAP